MNITITGYFGDQWLTDLLPCNVGPSPAPYTFDGGIELIKINPDGSALARTTAPDGDYRTSYHTDGTACKCYPCSHDKKALWYHVFEYKTRMATIPAANWKPGGRPSSFRSPSRTIHALDGTDITCQVTHPAPVAMIDGILTPIEG